MIPPFECKWGLKFLELKVTYSWFHNDRRWKKYARSLSLDSNRRQGFATRKRSAPPLPMSGLSFSQVVMVSEGLSLWKTAVRTLSIIQRCGKLVLVVTHIATLKDRSNPSVLIWHQISENSREKNDWPLQIKKFIKAVQFYWMCVQSLRWFYMENWRR